MRLREALKARAAAIPGMTDPKRLRAAIDAGESIAARPAPVAIETEDRFKPPDADPFRATHRPGRRKHPPRLNCKVHANKFLFVFIRVHSWQLICLQRLHRIHPARPPRRKIARRRRDHAAISPITAQSTHGSVVLTPNTSTASTRRAAIAPTTPIAAPIAHSLTPSPSTSQATLRGPAPSATRIPISRVLLATDHAITP